MENKWLLSPFRQLTEEERTLVWEKPATHIESAAEQRICSAVKGNWLRREMKITTILLEGDAGSGKTQLAKALSADFGLPYTKVTCFADMDKSDVLGSILPVLTSGGSDGGVEYSYYPSEIVRAYENGWLLEIQEPTVIRDAAVLMALNSALEPDGSINLPTRIVRRHPDFMAVITTNRGYNGCRPLNEALRDRVQHTEKMDLPEIEVMMERASVKTGCCDQEMLRTFARTITVLDQTAKANAIRGVAGMRSYFFWVDAVLQGTQAADGLYHKVIYKITTDPEEIRILEEALISHELLDELNRLPVGKAVVNDQVMELHTEGSSTAELPEEDGNAGAAALRKSADSKGHSARRSETAAQTQSCDHGEGGEAIYHQLESEAAEAMEQREAAFRKQLNRQAREIIKGSPHEKISLIVHRPKATADEKAEYQEIQTSLMPVIRELVRKTEPLLEYEVSAELAKNRLYGTGFHAEKLSSPDFRCFSKKRPPQEEPSLAVALRIDQSASMNAFGRLSAAKQAAVAVYEFCEGCGIPLLIYGDTADRSPREKMSLFSYIDWEEPQLCDKYSIMALQSYSNNRDGMALRILAEKLTKAPQKTKLLISLSDGQPKAMPDYTGDMAQDDMRKVIQEYSRRDVVFLAAAIGQDKEAICDIYGPERFMDMTNLSQLPARLVQIIANYL